MKKVLILEDEVNIRSFVVINLKRAGYEVIEAGAGREALEKLQQHPDIGVAILDIMLPDIDGFEVCSQIRASNKQIGIINARLHLNLTGSTVTDNAHDVVLGGYMLYLGRILIYNRNVITLFVKLGCQRFANLAATDDNNIH